jgi:hypothetical protein
MTIDPAIPENPTERRLSELIGWWLQVRCACERTTYYPFRFMASQMPAGTTLGDVLPRFWCERCGSKPTTLALVDNPAWGEGWGAGPVWIRVVLQGS